MGVKGWILTVLLGVLAFASTFGLQLSRIDASVDVVEPVPTPPPDPPTRREGVASDCYEDGFVCDKERVKLAENVDEVLLPVLADAGWGPGCYELQLMADEDGTMFALSIELQANDRGGCPTSVQRTDLSKVSAAVKKTMSGRDGWRQMTLQVTNGDGEEVRARL